MTIFAYFETLKKPYNDYLEKHPKVKILQLLITFFLSGWTFKKTTQEVLKIVNETLVKKN